jgi:PTH1 family peptidyl-tRNA hydrolase
MKMIVGLGNPGRKYDGTRHNVGFHVVGRLATDYGDGKLKAKFRGEVMDAVVAGEKILLLCPLTYMNLSGQSVKEASEFYKISPAETLVVCDDFSLPLGKLRFRPKGSSGGQKGLQNILALMGTEEIPRLRIGIEPPPPEWDVADYVLSTFTKDEQPTVKDSVATAAKAAAEWVTSGIEACMNKYN